MNGSARRFGLGPNAAPNKASHNSAGYWDLPSEREALQLLLDDRDYSRLATSCVPEDSDAVNVGYNNFSA